MKNKNMTKQQYGKITKKVLLGIGLAGIIIVGAASPAFLSSVGKIILEREKNTFQRQKQKQKKAEERQIARTIARLNKNKLVILSQKKGVLKIKLSEKGLRRVKKIKFDDMAIEKTNHWDRKWRLVTFDIPDAAKRTARDGLRTKLKKLNFYPLQKSVFIHPYPCEKEIQILCELFEIWPYVNILLVEKIFNDEAVRKHFNL